MISKVDGPPKPNTSIPDEPTDSYFVGFSDSEFVDCKEPDVTSYEQSNPRYSWPFGLGDRLAAIWGEKEMQKSQVCCVYFPFYFAFLHILSQSFKPSIYGRGFSFIFESGEVGI